MNPGEALAAAHALLVLTREERALIDAGRLEELADLVTRRAEALARLDGALARPVPADVQDVIAATRTEAAQNLALLRVAQDDIARELSADGARVRALQQYAR